MLQWLSNMQLVGHNNKQEKLVYLLLQDWWVSNFVEPNVTMQR